MTKATAHSDDKCLEKRFEVVLEMWKKIEADKIG